ncbi:MAG: phosphotransferase enzyme family protein [Actinomycetales bacterium]
MADPAGGGATFEQFARAALPLYGLASDTNLTLLNVSENATFRIDEPDGGRSVLRVHRTDYHTMQAIESELTWITALRDEGIVETPPYIPTLTGQMVGTVWLDSGESRHVARFAFVEGVEPTEERLVEDFMQLGAITARLHIHGKSWRQPPGFTRFTWDFETSLGPDGHWGSWRHGMAVGVEEEQVLGRCADRIGARLAAYGKGPERFGLVHADMRLANLLVNGPQVTVIDFDDCGFSWFMYDLGSSLSFIEHEPYVPALVDSWVRGYRTVAPLTRAEEMELPTFIMLRRLLLVAWIGSHASTDLAQSMGEQYTRDSCRLAEEYLARSFE